MNFAFPFPDDVKIALIDDNQDFLYLTIKFLSKLNKGIKVEIFHSSEEFLKTFYEKEKDLDVIVSDYDILPINGLQLLEKVRKRSSIPFIIFTGKGREEIAMKALNLGATFYLQKSGYPDLMYMELNHFIIQAHQKYKAEKEIIQLETLYKTLVDLSVDSIIIHVNNRIIYANSSFIKLIGAKDEQEILNHHIKDFIKSESLSTIQANIQTVLEGNDAQKISVNIQRLDGTTFIVEGQGKPILYDNKRAVIVYMHDIKDKLKLRETRHLLSKLPIGMILSDKEGNILDGNEVYLNIVNFTKDELLNLKAADIYYNAQERKNFVELVEKNGQIYDYKVNIKCKSKSNNNIIKKEVVISAIRIRCQDNDYYLTIVKDETNPLFLTLKN